MALVTGGAGFIGSHLVERLLAANRRVRVLDDLSTGHRDNVPDGVELVEASIEDESAIRAAIDGCDGVHHLAAEVSVPRTMEDPERAFAVNLTAANGSPRGFPGAESLRTMQSAPAANVRVGLVFAGKRAAREGALVTRPGEPGAVVGRVTSGSYCPTLGTAAAMAMVDRDLAAAGTEFDVLIREAPCPARVAPLPLYRRPSPRT